MLDYSLGRSIYYVRTEGGGRWVRKMANFANDSTDRLPEMDAPFLFMKVYASYIYVFQNVGIGPAVDPINTPAVNGLD